MLEWIDETRERILHSFCRMANRMIPHCHGRESPGVNGQWGVESEQSVETAVLTHSTVTAVFEAQRVNTFTVVALAVIFAVVGVTMSIVAVIVVAVIILAVVVFAVSN